MSTPATLKLLILLTLLSFLSGPGSAAGAEAGDVEVISYAEKSNLDYLDATILGLVEGLTEYLPVSSTGHLILTNALLGLDGERPVIRSDGSTYIIHDEETGKTRPYSIGEAAYSFVIIIQAGAIAAVVLLYWKRLLSIGLGFIGKDKDGRKLGLCLIVAFLPAAFFGLLLDDLIEAYLGDNILAVAFALIVGALLMIAVERRRRRKNMANPQTEDSSSEASFQGLSSQKALIIGIAQCFAMWPGTSRSMATIIGGYYVGLRPQAAAEFSFLLGFITLSAASGYKMLTDGREILGSLNWGPLIVGCLVAFVSAAIAIRWFVGFLTRYGLEVFAYYRIVLAILVIVFIGRT